MKAALGKKGEHYSCMIKGKGVVNSEWCVFYPNDQLVIEKAFRIKAIKPGTFSRMAATHALKEQYTRELASFEDFLKEDNEMNIQDVKYASTFVFRDNTIPMSHETVTDSDKFTINDYIDGNVTVEETLRGTEITILNGKDYNEMFDIPYTRRFMINDPDLLHRFLSLLHQNKKNK